jgi:lipid II:glycine glycyltransferase (peptidoglycan interpeptide bridge formation enzyme)
MSYRFDTLVGDDYQGWVKHAQGLTIPVFQTHSWGEFRQASQRLSSLHCFLCSDDSSLVFARVEMLRIPVLGWPIFFIQHGPLICPSIGEKERSHLLEVFLEHLLETACQAGAIFVKIMPDVLMDRELEEAFARHGFRASRFLTLKKVYDSTVLNNISDAEDELFKRLSTRCRTAIRKALKSDLEFDSSNGNGSFEDFYHMFQTTGEKAGFSYPDKVTCRLLWSNISSRAEGKVYIARYNEIPLAGAFVVFSGGRATYLYGGSSNKERQRNASQFLHWHIIKDIKEKGIQQYDMGGVNRTVSNGGPGWGIYLFKSGFGGRKIDGIGPIEKVISPLKMKIFAYLYERKKSEKSISNRPYRTS